MKEPTTEFLSGFRVDFSSSGYRTEALVSLLAVSGMSVSALGCPEMF